MKSQDDLAKIGELGLKYLNTKYVAPIRTLTIEEITENKNHNIMMIDIAATLNYVDFGEVKYFPTAHEMWIKRKDIYEGDDNVTTTKVESLRGQFDQMKVREDENILKYSGRIKASLCPIRSLGGKIYDVTVVSKVLKPFFLFMQLEFQQFKRCDMIPKMI
jgi:hypothetical protein